MKVVVMLAQLLLGLSIIAGLHELGHLLFAKFFGMQVRRYAIGFPPNILQFQWGETVYAWGAIPLGGAVSIAGMVDESSDSSGLSSTPQSWEFRAKPAWQRLVVILGGVCFNIVSGMLIYAVIAFALGDTYLSKREVNKRGVVPNEVGMMLGFQEGDQIVDIGGHDFERFADVFHPSTLLTGNYYTVLRAGKKTHLTIPADLIEKMADSKGEGAFVAPRAPFLVKEVHPHGAAAQAGLQPGDQIMAVAGRTTTYLHQLKGVLEAYAGKQVPIRYMRSGVSKTVQARINEAGQLGFQPDVDLTYERKNYNIVQAILIGSLRAFATLKTNFVVLGKMFTGQLSPTKSLSGPIGIAQVFGTRFDVIHFWSILGFLSLSLAFANLLPIPALDGGHALWILFEMITGRKIPDKFLETAQKVGMTILLLLVGYALFNDMFRLL